MEGIPTIDNTNSLGSAEELKNLFDTSKWKVNPKTGARWSEEERASYEKTGSLTALFEEHTRDEVLSPEQKTRKYNVAKWKVNPMTGKSGGLSPYEQEVYTLTGKILLEDTEMAPDDSGASTIEDNLPVEPGLKIEPIGTSTSSKEISDQILTGSREISPNTKFMCEEIRLGSGETLTIGSGAKVLIDKISGEGTVVIKTGAKVDIAASDGTIKWEIEPGAMVIR